jgi:hypothetical protein
VAIPLQIQLFDAFMGSQEGIHSIILPDIFSSGGSKNVFVDKFARVMQIEGYSKQNASAYTTNTGATAAMIRSLIPYKGTAGGSTTRKLLFVLDDGVNEWEIWVSSDNGATATFLTDRTSPIGIPADFAQFQDTLYITNGKVSANKYDGTTMSTVGLTQSPTITSAESATSGNLLGNYRYKLVSTIAGVRQNGSAASTSLLVSNKRIDLDWTADANTSVDGYEIYRTTGNGTTYYYLTSIDGRTTIEYTDNTSDILLLEQRILEEHGDAPPVAYYCEPHKSRMWWLRTDANPTRAYWSDPGDPESVYSENYLDFSDSETVGDVCTGAMGNYEGLLVVFTEKAVWTVSGTGAVIGDIVDFTKTRTNTGIGSVSHRAAVRIPAGSKYSDQTGQLQTIPVSALAYFTPLGDIRVFDGDNDLIVSHPVKDTLRTFNYAQRAKIHAVIDSQNDQAIWFFPTGSNGEPNKCAVWNYRYGIFYIWETMPFSCVCEVDTADSAALLLTGQSTPATGGFIYTFLNGSSFDGSNIEAQWMTKTLYGVNEEGQPAVSNTKRWRWIDVLFRIAANVDINVEWLQGGAPNDATAIANVVISPDAETLMTADASVILTADGSSISLAAETAQKKALLQTAIGDYLHDEGVRLRIKTNSTAGAWALEAFQLAYQILPGMKRRDRD